MLYEQDVDSPIAVARRRIIYRASHRGTKELDFMLGHFCNAHVQDFDEARLKLFERLMDHEETQLQQWLLGQVELPQGNVGEMLGEIRSFHLNLITSSGPSEK